MAENTVVRARINEQVKEQAAAVLETMGLTVSDAFRLLMVRIAAERRLPLEVKVPNVTTRKAMAELEAGKGKKVASIKKLMADVDA